MKTRILLVIGAAGLLMYCTPAKRNDAATLIDSMRSQLETHHQVAQMMTEIGVMLDSIDKNRHAVTVGLAEGTNQNYVRRLEDINQYVLRSERKLAALEKTARRTRDAAYPAAIRKLKKDLEIRTHELEALKEQVALYKGQNDDLIREVSEKEVQLREKLALIQAKQTEVDQLNEQVQQLLVKSKQDEGESYFARAEAVEETANRTHLAPRKKKNTLKQALELYRMAQFYGKEGAEAKVDRLEKRLKKSMLL